MRARARAGQATVGQSSATGGGGRRDSSWEVGEMEVVMMGGGSDAPSLV